MCMHAGHLAHVVDHLRLEVVAAELGEVEHLVHVGEPVERQGGGGLELDGVAVDELEQLAQPLRRHLVQRQLALVLFAQLPQQHRVERARRGRERELLG